MAPPAPRLAGRVSRMWRWCAAGGAGGGPTGVSVTSGDRKVVAAPRLTHRSRGMAPLSRDDAASAPAPEWAGGAGEWRAPPVAPPLPAGDEPPWEECAGLGNRLEGPAWLALLDDDRDGDDDDGCCSIRQSASLAAAAADARPASRRPLRLRRPCWLLRSRTRLPRGRVMPGREPSPLLLSSSAAGPRNDGDRLGGGPLAEEPSRSFSLTEFRMMLS